MADVQPYILDGDTGWAQLIREFLRLHPWLLAWNISFLMVVPVAEIVMPHLYGRLVTVMQRRKDGPSWRRDVRRVVVWIVVFLVLTRFIYYLSEIMDTAFTTALHSFIRDRVLTRLLVVIETQPEGSTHIGSIVSKFIKLPWAVEHVINAWRAAIVPKIVVFICAAVYVAAVHDITLGVILLFLAAAYVGLVVYVPLHCGNKSIARDRLYNVMIDDVDDVLRNVVSVYSQGEEQTEKARIARRGAAYAAAYHSMVRCWLPSYGVVSFVTVMFLSIFIWRTVRLATASRVSTAALVPITIIMMYFINAFGTIPSIIRPLTMSYGTSVESSTILHPDNGDVNETGLERRRDSVVDGLVEHEQRLALEPRTAGMPHVACLARSVPLQDGVKVEFIDISYRYPKATHDVLSHFDGTFEAGMTTVVWGPIGSGKSTLLRLLLKYASPSSGQILIDNIPLSTLSTKELRRTVGYVPQQATLFDRSIMDNILYGNTPCRNADDALRVATALGLMTGIDGLGAWPQGLATAAGKGGSSLSGGQRQAVLVARALLKEPTFLVMDEPTSSMDTASKTLMHRLLMSPAPDGLRGKTVIIVTHDEFLLNNVADRVVYM